MKIFERDGKLNFVDRNNVLIGFDYNHQCCETFGWFIGSEIENETRENRDFDVDGFVIDPLLLIRQQGDDCFGTEFAIFRLVRDGEEKFLHLFNHHNGYYAHGFEILADCMESTTTLKEGSL